MIDWIAAIISRGFKIGSTTEVAVRRHEAPSSAAASRHSGSIEVIPAYMVTMTNGNEHQMISAATSPNAEYRSKVQEWPVIPSTSLTKPKSWSNRNSQTYDPAIVGVAQAPSAARNSSIRGTGCTFVASTASAVPTSRLPATHTAANTTVASSTSQNCLSPNRLA